MCEACLADMVCYKKQIGRFFLLRARKDWEDIKVGDFGMAQSNGPDFLFSVKPWKDPQYGWSDEQNNNATKEENDLADKWMNDVDLFDEQVIATMSLGALARLIKDALGEGFDPDKTDITGSFAFWLFHKLGEVIEEGELDD